MSGGRRRAGVVGAAAGVTAAGIGLGVAAHRYAAAQVRRAACAEGVTRGEPFGSLRGLPVTVTADDGVLLHAEIDGLGSVGEIGGAGEVEGGGGLARDGGLTIVFCHGYSLHQGCWHYQRRDLRNLGRLVFWDHRGHGRSGRGGRGHATIDQLGRDLHAVLRATAPSGPVVLVGHSMGGMTIMSLADQYPELFGDRVRGVALICTSAGRLAELTYGLPAVSARVVRRAAPAVVGALGRRASLVEPGRRAGRALGVPLVRRYGFSRHDADPAAVRFVNEMIAGTPIDVVADFYPALMDHDKITVLDVLSRVETVVVAGTDDRIAPAEHSRAIAAAVPSARLWVIPRAGHVAMLEWPEVVNDALRGLARRVRTASREERSA